MLKITTMLILFFLGIMANAQQTESRTVSGFTKITVHDGVEVIYTQNENIALTVESSTIEGLKNLITEVKNGELRIYQMNKTNQANIKIYLSADGISSFVANTKATITATAPVFTQNATIDLYSGAAFNATIKANGKIVLNAGNGTEFNIQVMTSSLEGNFKSNSRINLCGTAKNTTINASENAFCTSKNLLSDNIKINAQDNSAVLIFAKDKISINVADSGKVTYTGSPRHTQWNDNAYATTQNKNTNLEAVTLNYQKNKTSSKNCFNQEKSK